MSLPLIHILTVSSSYPGPIRVARQLVNHFADPRHSQEGSQHRNASQEVNGHWEEPREEHKEPVRLDDHADQREAHQHHDNTAEEGHGSTDLVLLEEEAERPVKADDAGQSAQEQDLE